MDDRVSTEALDARMMQRCLALSRAQENRNEYPYAVVICRNGELVCETVGRVAQDHDVTRHAEAVALSEAQKILSRTSLDDCTLYSITEPCASCGYQIREARIGRVVFGLRSPVMGGLSRWSILNDTGLSTAMPEVFAPPPEIRPGYMATEAADIFAAWNPVIWHFVKERRLLTADAPQGERKDAPGKAHPSGMSARLMRFLRRFLFDRIGRR